MLNTSFLTFPRLLATYAQSAPEQRVYTFLSRGEYESAHLTLGNLDRRARAVAAELSARCKPQDRALLIFHPGLDFITAFFGCLYAGVIAVPAYSPPPRREPALEYLTHVRSKAGAKVPGTIDPGQR
jgi:acyl-CoA synthetase (AMP-forming)/AMP-acid ligase II